MTVCSGLTNRGASKNVIYDLKVKVFKTGTRVLIKEYRTV